jgi:hypothetical protein
MRPRFSVAGGKSERFDSFVLAELARTDSHRFRVLEPDSDQTKALRAMTRARESLVRTRVGLANQLRDHLAGVEALEVGRGRPEVDVAELALDDVDGNARGPRVRLRGHGGVDRERTAAESLLRR